MEPVLDLSTTQKRVPVRIDGKAYSLRTLYDLSFSELQQTQRAADQIATILEHADTQTDLSKVESAKLVSLLRKLCKLTLIAPPKVQASLSMINLLTLYRVFAGTFVSDIGVLLAQGIAATPPNAPTPPRRKKR